jgi:hypothetical protein
MGLLRSSTRGFRRSFASFFFLAAVFAFTDAIADENITPTTEIPLVVVLWKDVHYNGLKRELVVDTPNLDLFDFNHATSSVGVHPGPDYARWKAEHGGREPTVTLYSETGGRGTSIVLRTGIYPDLKQFNMNDKVSSAYFSDSQNLSLPPAGAAAPFNAIHFVVVLYTASDKRIWLVESTQSLRADYGSQFDNAAVSALVVTRSSATPPETVKFCEDDFFDRCSNLADLSNGAPLKPGEQTFSFVLASFTTGPAKPNLSSVQIQ